MSALSKTTRHEPDGAQHARLRPVGDSRAGTRPDVDIVVPVFNEQSTLEVSVVRLHDFLAESFPFSWRIAIADNASTDGTLEIARRLGDRLDAVTVIHLPERGRGRALRAAWSASNARVLCYMDVDLSTDRLQQSAETGAPRPLQRRPMRLQGDPLRCRPAAHSPHT